MAWMKECFIVWVAALGRRIVGTARSIEIYQFKVTLIGIAPPIWRRMQLPGGFSLAQLHRALQVAMGWEAYHLYMFRIGSKNYGPPDVDEDDDLGLIDAKRTRLSAVLPNVGTTFTYVYDYGDDWEHELLLEAIVMPDPATTYPRCVTGERRCPPEDVGGIGGYTDYLEAMADPNHEQHEEVVIWRGPFDPEDFSVEKVNQELAKKFRSKPKPSAPHTATATPKPFVKSHRMIRTLITPVPPRMQRTPVKSGEIVPLELNQRERDLIISHTFADESLTNRLRIALRPGQRPVFHFTLDELDELVGDVAAEANHVTNKALQEQLDQLCDRIEGVLSRYTDADA
jgi:hypothetical protein